MGRHNHENSVGIPGLRVPGRALRRRHFDAPAPSSTCTRRRAATDVWNDNGQALRLRRQRPGDQRLRRRHRGDGAIPGRFIEVPREIATGKDADDGSEVTSADFGYPLPSASPTTTPPYPKPATAAMPDGPQWVLEHWSNEHNVFQFIRVEDIAYDRRPGMSNVVYLADTGEPRAKPSAIAGWTRLERSATGGGPHMNGRIFKLTLGSNPLEGATLDILPGANFDALGYNSTAAVHQPDNIETTIEGSLHPGGHRLAQRPVGRVPGRNQRPDLAISLLHGHRAGRRRGQPGDSGRSDPVEPRRLGVERHRRRFGGLRPWRVPRGRPGATAGIRRSPVATICRRSRSARTGSCCCYERRARRPGS